MQEYPLTPQRPNRQPYSVSRLLPPKCLLNIRFKKIFAYEVKRGLHKVKSVNGANSGGGARGCPNPRRK